MIIPVEFIIEIGLLRKRGICANCKKPIDVPNHNIQLCKKCRNFSISEYIINGYTNCVEDEA